MDKILKILLEEKERFIKLLHRIEKTKITELDGCLVINTNKKKRYYHQTIDEEGNRTRKFLKTKDKALIKLSHKNHFSKNLKNSSFEESKISIHLSKTTRLIASTISIKTKVTKDEPFSARLN